MRPNQNNKNRQRGRNNNNGGRKHINPLSRNFESNGPDVKVRGNASHVAEKYLQLARDAQSSGDPVLAENYLQHAEHYFRIVAAAQPQNQFRPDQPGGQAAPEVDEDDDFPPINDRFASPEPRVPFQPQPQEQPQGGMMEAEEGEQPALQGEGGQGDEGQQSAGQFQGDGNGEGGRRRDRNRRRRGRGQGDGNQGGNNTDPGEAPQPEVGELPAFLTA
ncbi:MAG TPA: DUF4167 domain-containing protein, partial [Rhizomicrobium sp.]|nr:DUF4167 domain-containing protein [Rhizomicrobium sp.]